MTTFSPREIVSELDRYIVGQDQAKKAVATYTRAEILFWLEHTAVRRAKGELGNPGAYFFSSLKRNAVPKTYQDIENDRPSDEMEI